MKRAAIVIVLLGLVVGVVLAGGRQEAPLQADYSGQWWFHPDAGDTDGQIAFDFRWAGATEVDVAIPGKTIRAAFYRLDGTWYNGQPGYRPLPSGWDPQVQDPGGMNPLDPIIQPLIDLDVARGDGGSLGISLSQLVTAVRPVPEAPYGFSMPYDGSSKHVEFYAVTVESPGLVKLDITVEHEFFQGENEFFAEQFVGSLASLDYRERALAFLCSVMEKSDAPSFRSIVSGELGPVENVFGGSEYSLDDDSDYAHAARALKGRIDAHLESSLDTVVVRPGAIGSTADEGSMLELPVLAVPENVASTWYGEERNIYIHAYLTYLYARYDPKPPLERIMYQTLSRHGVNYDFTDYFTLSDPLFDQAALAESALRYLTWGLEYSLEDRVELSENMRDVFADAYGQNDTALASWIRGDAAGPGTPQANFAPTVFSAGDSGVGEGAFVPSDLADNPYFQHDATGGSGQTTGLSQRYSTPFGDSVTGNPIAYADGGIDTPRTFNYKLYEQLRARAYQFAYARGALPINENGELTTDLVGLERYVVEPVAPRTARNYDQRLNTLQITIGMQQRPFIPGDPGAAVALPDWNRAGVGNLELLAGALSMTPYGAYFLGADNSNVVEPYLQYAGMGGLTDRVDAFVDENGRPEILSWDDRREEEPKIALSRADLERSTVIVPDIAELQLGDILVRFHDPDQADRFQRFAGAFPGENLPPEVAIVVGYAWESGTIDRPDPGDDVRQWWDRVYVVTASPRLEAVVLASWADGQVMSGFTDVPEMFQMRRLMINPAQFATPGNDAADQWDLLDRRVVSLSPVMTWIDDPYEEALNHRRAEEERREDIEQHWIPNTLVAAGTYEVLEATDIRVFGVTNSGREVTVNQEQYGGEYVPVRFLPPEDMYAAEEPDDPGDDTDYGNVYRNAGGGIEIVVFDDANNEWQAIARFERVENADGLSGDARRFPYAENVAGVLNEWHQWSGHEEDRDGLYVHQDQLVFRIREYSPRGRVRSTSTLTRFGVRMINHTQDDGTELGVRPGDDFLLRLGYTVETDQAEPDWTSHEAATGTASDEDFVAVYDKKLVWRANLYIDERMHPTDTRTDWNDLHPWIYDNDWAYSQATAQAEGRAYVLGGQNIGIRPWTRFSGGTVGRTQPGQAPGDGQVFSVAYGWGGHDSVAEFNAEMDEQAARLSTLYNSNGGEFEAGETAWSGTQAPANDWKAYGGVLETSRSQDTHLYEGTLYYYWLYSQTEPIPALSTYLAFSQDAPDNSPLNEGLPEGLTNAGWRRNYRPIHVDLTAGLDCSGFVQQAASYEMQQQPQYQVHLGEKQSTTMIASDDNSWLVAEAAADEETEHIGLERLVPGDIVVLAGEHVVLITEITHPADGSPPQPEDIAIVHSRRGNVDETLWQVGTQEYWSEIVDQWAYSARRLR